jgi:type IV secretory pathway VirB2 component (pilin)
MIRRIAAALLCFGLVFSVALAPAPATYAIPCTTGGSFLSFPSWNEGLECEKDSKGTIYVNVEAVGIETFVWTVVLNGLRILLQIAGILAVVMIIVSGYQYLTSAGSPDKVAKAKTRLLQAIVGLAIALLSSSIVYFINSWII